ncbi:MAG: hypothetical protein MJK12_11095 [Colwellia sp.]|nr:hypothetical protein [Colwellia sp.]
MKYIKHIIFTLFICFSSTGFSAIVVSSTAISSTNNSHADDETLKILFIGNSFTGRSYLPTVLQEIAKSNGKKIVIKAEIQNGTSLYQHWEKGIAQQKISAEKWHYVILQDNSASAFEHPEKTIKYGVLFSKLATQQGAKPLLYNTWAYKGIPTWIENKQYADIREEFKIFVPNMYQKTNALYQNIADKSESSVVPVAQVWKVMNEINSSVALHAVDQSHPSPTGTYLTAVVFYKAVFNEVPKVLPAKLQTQRNQQKMTELITININETLSQQILTAVNSVSYKILGY